MTSVNSQFRVYFPEHAQHFHHSSVETIVKSIAGEYNSSLPQVIRLLETATKIDASKTNPNVRNFVTTIMTVLSKTYNLRENSSRFLELKSLFDVQVKAYDASHAIPGAHQADAVAQRRMPQAAAAPHILPQELIGLIGMHVPAQEVARRDGGGASLQTAAETLGAISSALGAPVSEQALRGAYSERGKEFLSQAIEAWLHEIEGPFVLPQSLQHAPELTDLTFLQPLFEKITSRQLHFILEELVRKIPTITALDLFKADVTPKTLQLLRALPQLSSLSIGCRSTRSFEEIGALTTLTTLKLHAECVLHRDDKKNYATAMAHLCKLTNLRRLDMLNYKDMSDAGLAHLQQLKQLRCLTLTGCQKIGNLAVNNLLEALSNLQSLDLSSCSEITDAALASLRHMKYLQHLNLHLCSGITDAGTEVLPVTLLTLDLSETRGITPAGLAVLSTLRLLTSLNLSCKHLNDEVLQHLSELVHLQHLKLGSYSGGNGITGSGFRYLSKLTSLITLDLRSAEQLTAEGLAHCAQFTALEELELFAAHIPRGGLVGLQGLTNLRCLSLTDCKGMTDEELASVADLTNLQELDLNRVRSITDRGIQYLAKLIQLRKLDLEQTQLTAEGMRYLANLTELEDLELAWCSNITDAGLVHLAGMHKLRNLGLVACKKLIGTGLVHLTKLKALQKLKLAGCNNLTEAAARPLQECTGLTRLSLDRSRGIPNPAAIFVGIPTLEHLDIRDCGMTDSEAVACVAQLPALKTLIYSRNQNALGEELIEVNPRLVMSAY